MDYEYITHPLVFIAVITFWFMVDLPGSRKAVHRVGAESLVESETYLEPGEFICSVDRLPPERRRLRAKKENKVVGEETLTKTPTSL
jgi:hypothetical protein